MNLAVTWFSKCRGARSHVYVLLRAAARLAGYVLLLNMDVGIARAQHDVLFDHLTVKQGLSQAAVICIYQDSQGFMWFGTQDGLNRYDGYEFRIFRHDPADPRSLNDNWILSIGETSDNILWIGTRENPGVINRFDRMTETFGLLSRDSVNLAGARFSSSRPDYLDSFGTRWSGFGSVAKGIALVNPKTGSTTFLKHDPANPKSLIDDRVYGVYGDRRGTVWVATHEGLDRYNRETNTFTHFAHDDKNPGSLSDNWVWPIFEDRTGGLWVGTFRRGLNRFDRSSETFVHFRHDESDTRSIGDDRIYSIYQDRSGIIWVGTGDHGVDRFHPELGAFSHYAHDPSNPLSLINDNITSIFVDRSGVPWIGTRAGLNRLDRMTKKFALFTHEASNPKSIADNQAQSFLEDRSGILWVGTVTNGLDRFDRRRNVFTHFQHDPANPRSLSDNRVYALCEGRTGDFWVGTYGGGLNRLDRVNGTFQAYVHNDSVPGSLGGAGVWALCEDHEGTLWVGTFGGGLDRFERDRGTFSHFKHDDANPQSLSDDVVACLYEDRRGTLWVGTAGGLNRFDRESGTFKRYREKDGLPNDVIFGILEDDHGNLWMSTNKGLSRFDPVRESFRNYDYNDGLAGNEFNQGAYARDPQTGEMYFGGGNGVNVFHPDSVRDNPYVAPVVFSSFVRYNSDDKQGKPIEEKGIGVKPQITLTYKDNVANFEFSALNYLNTFKNNYAYKLEGFNENWIQLGTDHRATFTNLDGGEYTLRVKGSNNDGIWNEEGAALRLVVMPPWWKTRWAYGTYAFLFLCALYGIRRFEINRQLQKQQVRESELRAKAAEAEKRALAAENERKTKELEDARQLQFSMLPREVPQLPDYEIAVFMRTATEVGGDYYDFSVAPDGTLNVALGDATGHGMQAGTIVTLMKGLFLSDASRFDIQAFFSHCSKAIKDIRLGRLYMAFTLLRLKGNSLSLSSAGMPPAFLFRKGSGAVEEILLKGMPLGAMKNFPYALHEEQLSRGDTVLLLTDGLPEQKNAAGDMFDYAKVQETFTAAAAKTPGGIIQYLVEAGDSWMHGVPLDDDITLLVIRMKES